MQAEPTHVPSDCPPNLTPTASVVPCPGAPGSPQKQHPQVPEKQWSSVSCSPTRRQMQVCLRWLPELPRGRQPRPPAGVACSTAHPPRPVSVLHWPTCVPWLLGHINHLSSHPCFAVRFWGSKPTARQLSLGVMVSDFLFVEDSPYKNNYLSHTGLLKEKVSQFTKLQE